MSKQERGDPDNKHAERNGPETSRSGKAVREEAGTEEAAEEQNAEEQDNRVTARQPFPIVGVGASAGGIEALTRFVKSIRRESGMAYVLILHLDPSKGSQLADILGRETEVPVVNAEDGLAIEADHIYVCVPDRDIRIANGAFRLDKQIRDQGPPHPVDVFLNSLAENQANLAAAIILSGTGSNGSHGIKAINQYGGIILVQDPETARFCGMPAATISSGLADFVLPPEAMAETLSSYFDTTAAPASLDTTERPQQLAEQLAKILDTIRSKGGCDFQGYKKKMLLRRIRRRMGLIGVLDLDQYNNYLNENAAEVVRLTDDLLIGVTGFFRDPDAWEALDDLVIRPLIKDSTFGQKLRVWVPGCASGEEAYSIAILLAERAAEAGKPLSITIFATDASTERLTKARQALFPLSISAEVSRDRLNRFFSRDDHGYRLNNEIRDLVVFAPHNLLNDPPFSKMDLISCRNVLIYLDSEIQKQLIPVFHFSLCEGGHLFLGSAETLGRFDHLFNVVSKKWKIWRRIGSTRHDIIDFPLFAKSKVGGADTQDGGKDRRSMANMLSTALLERFAPPSVLVDRKCRVRFLHGNTSRYLTLPPGEPTTELMMLARERLRGPIRRTFKEASETGQAASVDVCLKENEPSRAITVTTQPVRRGNTSEELFLVSFEERGAADSQSRTSDRHVDLAASEADFEEQLRSTREELRSAIEDLETSNEELKASNEEVTSINEELQSTNEELETSKEELQSLNEELNSVNNQLYAKLDELERRSDDLRNLLSSTDIATIFLDPEYRIRWFTPPATKLFHIIHSDVYRPISSFAQNFNASS